MRWCRDLTWRSTAVLFVLATVVNVTFSVVGGLVLHLASLREIERSVEETSDAEISANINKLNHSFSDVFWTSKHTADNILLNGTVSAATYDEVLQMYSSSQLATLRTSNTLFSMGIAVAPLGEDAASDPKAMSLVTWWDALTNATHIARNGGNRQWAQARYKPEFWAHDACKPDEGEYTDRQKRCALVRFMNEDGADSEYAYAIPDINLNALFSGEWDEAIAGWEEFGATFWRPLDYWDSRDGTVYSYATHVRVLPRVHTPPFRNSRVVCNTFVSFYGWLDQIDTSADTAMLVVARPEGGAGTVLTSNLDLDLMRRGCLTLRSTNKLGSAADCATSVSELPARLREGAALLSTAPEGVFLSADLDGDSHWLRRAVLFRPRPVDMLVPIDLMWMREQSTVQEKLDRALVNFVFFVVGSAVLSTIVLTLLVLGISVPLGRVASAMRHLDAMELEQAEAELPAVRRLQVTEVSILIRSVLKALVSLRTYRDFLPRCCLELSVSEARCGAGGEEEEAEEGSGPRSSEKTSAAGTEQSAVSPLSVVSSGSVRGSSVRPPSLLRLLDQELEHRTVTIAAVNVVSFLSDERGVQRHKAVLSAVMQCRADGVLDGCFGDRCRVSWNGSRVVANQKVRAAKFLEAMRERRSPSMPLVSQERQAILSLAATSGKARCGFAGCEGSRYYTIVGRHVSLAFVLERAACAEARRRGVSVAIVPRNVQEDAATAVRCRFLMLVRWQKLTADTALYETVDLVPDSADTAEEWMYIVSRLDRASVWGIYNDAALLLSTGSAAEARQRLRERAVGSDAGVEVLYSELVSAADGGSCGFRTRELCDDPVRIPAADVVERV